MLPDITPGQGAMLSGLFTALGAVIGVIFASRFLSGKVKTIQEALSATQLAVSEYAKEVQVILGKVKEDLDDINAQSGGLASGLALIQSDVAELTDAAEGERGDARDAQVAPEPVQQDLREQLKKGWLEIREELERRASDDGIDGRTRAAYGRVDRRSYYDLVTKMTAGGHLTEGEAKVANDAFALWQSRKGGLTQTSEHDLATMSALRNALLLAHA